ncbi:unnamed protein product [Polarella glacialis]|uniref:Molybdate-anion transporter n=1 Tax=Polarella glacialis TaxID=89957 RepID=A0A813H9B7_POLGL|nr:unnamed protein product [Polarella glacialis]
MHLLCGDVYRTIFWPLLVATAGLAWRTRPKVEAALPPGFSSYQRRYLIVWSLAVAADWLQGPYVYALYASYGYGPAEIAKLFVMGFGSSAIAGTFIGSALLCAELGPNVLYAGSCVTKHSGAPVSAALCKSSVLGGISTSLLFSTFEEKKEQQKKKKGEDEENEKNKATGATGTTGTEPTTGGAASSSSTGTQPPAQSGGRTVRLSIAVMRLLHIPELLRYMFGLMFFVQLTFLAGKVKQEKQRAEILAHLAASSAPYEALCVLVSDIRRWASADERQTTARSSIWHYGGYTAPFDISLVCLLLAIPAIQMTWTENYGDNKAGGEGAGIVSSLRAGARAMGSNWQVPVLGLAVAAFEGSMYCFVFNWTPALDAGGGPPPPHGLIFSSFMMACMCGSSFFGMLDSSYRPVKVLLPVIVAAAAALGLIGFSLARGSTSNAAIFAGFLIFEACVGAYFPCMGTVKSQVVPEDARAGVYNVYRVPLNFFVIFLLLTDISLPMQFGACCCLLLVAAGAVVLIGRAGQTR